MIKTSEKTQKLPSFIGLFLCALFGFVGIIIGLIRIGKGRKLSGNRIVSISAVGFATVAICGTASGLVPFLGLVGLPFLIWFVAVQHKKIKNGTLPWD